MAERRLRKFTGMRRPYTRSTLSRSSLRSSALSSARGTSASIGYTLRGSMRRPRRRLRRAYRRTVRRVRRRTYGRRRYRRRGGYRARRFRSRRKFTISRVAGSIHPTLVRNSSFTPTTYALQPGNMVSTRSSVSNFLPFSYPDYTVPANVNQRIFGPIAKSIINLSYDWSLPALTASPAGQAIILPPSIRWNLYIFRKAKEDVPIFSVDGLGSLHQGGFFDRTFDQTGLKKFLQLNQLRLLIFRRGMFYKRSTSLQSVAPSTFIKTPYAETAITDMAFYLNYVVPRSEFELKLSLPVGTSTQFLPPGVTNLGTRRWRYRCFVVVYISERDWHQLPAYHKVPYITLQAVVNSTQFLRVAQLPITTGTPELAPVNQMNVNQL